jgi:hypothetical protein
MNDVLIQLIEYAKKRLATMTQYNGLSYGHKGLDPEYGENIYRTLGLTFTSITYISLIQFTLYFK